MRHRLLAFCAVQALMAWTAAAQDAQSVLQAAATAMGATNLKSIQYSGTGWKGAVGQNFSPELDWPRFQMTSYTRTIDFDARSSKEEMVLIQGNNSPRGGGGTPIEGERQLVFLVSGDYAWNMQGDNVIPTPAAAEVRQLELNVAHGTIFQKSIPDACLPTSMAARRSNVSRSKTSTVPG